MNTCRICTKREAAAVLGVCGPCIRSSWKKVREAVREAHALSRAPLPPEPPRFALGLTCRHLHGARETRPMPPLGVVAMPRRLAVGPLVLAALMPAALALCSCRQAEPASLSSSKTQQASAAAEEIPLPPPRTSGDVSLEEALDRRYSFREFSDKEISLEQIAQVLWAGAGIPAGVDAVSGATRLPPSAGATYPTDLYLVAGRVKGLRPGVYAYSPGGHALKLTKSGDLRRDVSEAALGQSWLSTAPASAWLSVCRWSAATTPLPQSSSRRAPSASMR